MAKTIPYLLLVQAFVCTWGEDYTSLPNQYLNCYNDFNQNLTCFWNSTYGNTECTVHAEKISKRTQYNGSCKLEPVDITRPLEKKCSVVFKRKWRKYPFIKFQTFHVLTINVNCNNTHHLSINYSVAAHVKLSPPTKPNVNLSHITWSSQAQKHERINNYKAQLQWKKKDQPWSMHSPLVYEYSTLNCTKLLSDDIILGEWYEARVRVKVDKSDLFPNSTWSEWSPIVSWKARTGKDPPIQGPSGVTWSVLSSFLCAAALAVLLLIMRLDKTRWVYIVKRIRGPPLPNPEKSFLRYANFQNLVSPRLNGQPHYSLSKHVDIVPVEVTSPEEVVSSAGLYTALQEKMKRSRECYESSNFSNPSYSHLTSPPILLPSASNLDTCDTDSPYSPVGFQRASRIMEENSDDAGTSVRLQQLFFSSKNSNRVPVVLEYEKVPPQEQGFIFQRQHLEPSCEWKLEAGGTSWTCGPDEAAQPTVAMDRMDFQKLFDRARILNEGSIQVCPGYEQVQNLRADNNELPSEDSGVSSGVEEQASQEESLEEAESHHLLFSSPPPPPPLPCASQL